MEDSQTYFEQFKGLVFYRRRMPEAFCREEILNQEAVTLLFDDLKKEIYKLKGNSARIWKLLDGKNTLFEIVETLKKDAGADVPTELVIKDVCKFVSHIGKLGLIKAAKESEI